MKLKGITDAGFRRLAQVVSPSSQGLEIMTLEEFQANPIAGYKFDARLPNEANANDDEVITLGPSFFDLAPDGRLHVIYHEAAHRIVDDLQQQSGFWETLYGLVNSGAFGPKYDDGYIDGINGQLTPIENLVEAFAVYGEEPEWLREKYPQVYEYVSEVAV